MLTAARILHHRPASASSASSSSASSSSSSAAVPASLAHTAISRLLVSDQPMAAMFSVMYTLVAHVSTVLPAYFDAYGRREPRGTTHVPSSFLAGEPDVDYFTLLRRDEAAMRSFTRAMAISSRRVPVTGMYDMGPVLREAAAGAKKKRDVVWVDVGGGDGNTLRQFLSAYPGLRAEQCVVQDLEEVVNAAAEKQQRKQKADGDVLRGVRWVKMDFFREAPIKGQYLPPYLARYPA